MINFPYSLKQSKKPVICLATKNKSKIKDFKLYIDKKYTVKTPNDYPEFHIDIAEGIHSIAENALAKARAYAAATDLVSLGDDTGFFIEQLDGEPGVAVRRWGGELPESTTSEEFWRVLKDKTAHLDKIDCYFEQCIAIAAPNGAYELIYSKNKGTLNKEKLKMPYNGSNYPLGQAFEATNRAMTWDEMTDEQKKAFDAPLIEKINAALDKLCETGFILS